MTLDVDASSRAQALDRAMAWRDAVSLHGPEGTDAALDALGFTWHLHHPWGC